jgi:rhamnosyltransferase
MGGPLSRGGGRVGCSSMTSRHEIAVVIPTFNGGRELAALLDALATQEGSFRPTVVAIDSGSSDGSLDVLRRHEARILATAHDEFNHGRIRNQALRSVDTEFAVLMVQDAVPSSARWLEALVTPLVDDRSIAGTWARQLPREDASRITEYALSRWIGAGSTPRTVGPLSAEQLAALAPPERHLACAFDNVCSCIRMSVWRAQPFPHAEFAEDIEWGMLVLRAGHRLAFVPEAAVRHSHERSVWYELQRTYLAHRRLQSLFGLATVPTAGDLVRAVCSTLPVHIRLAAGEPSRRPRALARAVGLAVAWPLGQYLGAKSVREGRELLKVRGV